MTTAFYEPEIRVGLRCLKRDDPDDFGNEYFLISTTALVPEISQLAFIQQHELGRHFCTRNCLILNATIVAQINRVN